MSSRLDDRHGHFDDCDAGDADADDGCGDDVVSEMGADDDDDDGDVDVDDYVRADFGEFVVDDLQSFENRAMVVDEHVGCNVADAS